MARGESGGEAWFRGPLWRTLLVLASTLIVPTWARQMMIAPHETPIPTDHYPWIGNTWLLVLRSLGLEGTALWIFYAVLAVPIRCAGFVLCLGRGGPGAERVGSLAPRPLFCSALCRPLCGLILYVLARVLRGEPFR